MQSTYDAACYYINALNWHLVPIPPGIKGPLTQGWNDPSTITDATHWKDNPSDNMGVLLEPSGIVVVDIDNIEETKILFELFGIDYDTILNGSPRIQGRPGHDKAIFLAPENIQLGQKKLAWENKDDPNSVHTVLEFRGGLVQDVLPPSIHPDTQKPYKWKKEPEIIPPLPKEFLSIWTNWGAFRPQLINACPWAKNKVLPPQPKKIKTPSPADDNIIQKFNDANHVTDILERHGYRKVSSSRWLSPFSTTGLAGVCLLSDNRIYSHHGSEPFDTSKSHDAFDMFCHFDHKGDIKSALIAAAKQLGIKTEYEKQIEHGKGIVHNFLKSESDKQNDAIDAIIKKARTADELPSFPEITHPLFRKWMDLGSRIMYSRNPYHFGNLLAIASMAIGRRAYAGISTQKIFTNVNIMSIGTSTISGKSFSAQAAIDHFASAVVNIQPSINPADASRLVTKSISDSSFIQQITLTHNLLWYYDESRGFFDDADGWNSPIITTLCSAYDGTQLSRNLSKKGKSEEHEWICPDPFVSCLFNMTIHDLQEVSRARLVKSGFFIRWMWFYEEGGEMRKNVTMSEEDEKTIYEIRDELHNGGLQIKQLPNNSIKFLVNDKIETWKLETSKKYSHGDNENQQSAIGRAFVHMYKIAMIFSMFDPEFQDQILDQSGVVAVDIPDRWVDEAIKIVDQYLFPRMIFVLDLSQEYDTKNKLNIIISCLKAFHGSADRTSLLRKSRLDKKEFDSATATLIESGEIIEVQKKNPNAKFPMRVYCLNR